MFTREMARRYPHVKCVSLHPGVVNTEFIRNLSEKYRIIDVIINLKLIAAECRDAKPFVCYILNLFS